MKIRSWFATLALALALVPAALAAQDEVRPAERSGSGYMGIYFGWDEGDNAAEVREVIAGSPADRAGIRVGDLVVRLNGRPATREAVDELRVRLERGDTVRLRTRRDGREEERVVVAAARPSRVVYGGAGRGGAVVIPGGEGQVIIHLDSLDGAVDSLVTHMGRVRDRLRRDSVILRAYRSDTAALRVFERNLERTLPQVRGQVLRAVPWMMEFGDRSVAGADFTPMNAGLGRYFHTSEGLLVLEVAPTTPAGRGGLQAGDVVLQANGNRVSSVRSLREIFARADGREVRLTVLRDGRRQELNVRWEPTATWRVQGDRARVEAERLRPSQAPRARSRTP